MFNTRILEHNTNGRMSGYILVRNRNYTTRIQVQPPDPLYGMDLAFNFIPAIDRYTNDPWDTLPVLKDNPNSLIRLISLIDSVRTDTGTNTKSKGSSHYVKTINKHIGVINDYHFLSI